MFEPDHSSLTRAVTDDRPREVAAARQRARSSLQQSPPRHPALERLICAAMCTPRLAAILLTTPAVALGSSNDGWRLTAAERALVLAVTDASDIHDFAGQLHGLAAGV